MANLNTNLSKNKKANLLDFAVVARFLLVVLLLGFSFTILIENFRDGVNESGTLEEGENYTDFMDTSVRRVNNSLDFVSMAFFVCALVFSIIMARKIKVNTVSIIIVLLISFVFVVISALISNVYGGILSSNQIREYVLVKLPITNIFLQYLPFITLIYVGITMIVFFNKD